MKKRHIIFNKSRWEKIAYLEPYKDNDNSINYQDLDANQDKYAWQNYNLDLPILVKC